MNMGVFPYSEKLGNNFRICQLKAPYDCEFRVRLAAAQIAIQGKRQSFVEKIACYSG
jgi:hypothetical protein